MRGLIAFLMLTGVVSAEELSKFSYRVELQVDGAGVETLDLEELRASGWSVEGDEWESTYIHGGSDISLESLPFRLELGEETTFSIRKKEKSYLGCVEVSIGDADAGAETCSYLKKGSNVFFTTAGNYASGAWSLDGKVVIWLK